MQTIFDTRHTWVEIFFLQRGKVCGVWYHLWHANVLSCLQFRHQTLKKTVAGRRGPESSNSVAFYRLKSQYEGLWRCYTLYCLIMSCNFFPSLIILLIMWRPSINIIIIIIIIIIITSMNFNHLQNVPLSHWAKKQKHIKVVFPCNNMLAVLGWYAFPHNFCLRNAFATGGLWQYCRILHPSVRLAKCKQSDAAMPVFMSRVASVPKGTPWKLAQVAGQTRGLDAGRKANDDRAKRLEKEIRCAALPFTSVGSRYFNRLRFSLLFRTARSVQWSLLSKMRTIRRMSPAILY